MDLRRPLLPLAVLMSLSLEAQEFDSASIGVQARISKAEAGLKDVSDSPLPGLGGSLVAEVGLAEGYRARLDIGYDQWPKGSWSGRPDIEGSASAYHVSLEGVLMLDADQAPEGGPYVLAGAGAYAWTITETGGESTRNIHAALTLGMGWRLAKALDLEFKVLAGRIVPARNAGALLLGLTYRLNP